jgi:hypothetical protein
MRSGLTSHLAASWRPWGVAAASLQATHATPALAFAAGRVCLFDAPTGARIIKLTLTYTTVNAGDVGWT